MLSGLGRRARRGARGQRGRQWMAAGMLAIPGLALACLSCATPPEATPQTDLATALVAGRRALDAGHFQRAREQLAPALRQADSAEPATLRIDALLAVASAERSLANFQAASGQLQRARELARQARDPARSAAVELALGANDLARGADAEAQAWLESAIRFSRNAGRPGLEAAALNDLGRLQAADGDSEAAFSLFEESVTQARLAGDLELQARAASNAARAAANPEQAARWRERALERCRALPDSFAKATLLLNLAEQEQLRADTQPALADSSRLQAAELYAEALRVADAIGSDRMASYALGGLSEVHASAGRPDSSLSLARRAHAHMATPPQRATTAEPAAVPVPRNSRRGRRFCYSWASSAAHAEAGLPAIRC